MYVCNAQCVTLGLRVSHTEIECVEGYYSSSLQAGGAPPA
jgi:hypothetical protein